MFAGGTENVKDIMARLGLSNSEIEETIYLEKRREHLAAQGADWSEGNGS